MGFVIERVEESMLVIEGRCSERDGIGGGGAKSGEEKSEANTPAAICWLPRRECC